MPRTVFDPADPKAIGRMVSIALLAQERVPLQDVRPAYGAGALSGRRFSSGSDQLQRRRTPRSSKSDPGPRGALSPSVAMRPGWRGSPRREADIRIRDLARS